MPKASGIAEGDPAAAGGPALGFAKTHVREKAEKMVVKTTRRKRANAPVRTNFSRMPSLNPRRSSTSLVNQADIKVLRKRTLLLLLMLCCACNCYFHTPVLLNGCAQGNSGFTRIGRRLLMKSILFRYFFAPGSSSCFRILVVYDKQTNGALPATTDVVNTTDAHAPLNLINADRFVTVFDKIVDVNDVNMDTLYRKVNLECLFGGTAQPNRHCEWIIILYGRTYFCC